MTSSRRATSSRMGKLLLSLHVIAAIVFVGPVTVAVSLFPRYARLALDGDAGATAVLRLLHRISRVYAVLGLSVPVLGIALASRLGVLGDAWLLVSIALRRSSSCSWWCGPARRRGCEPCRTAPSCAG